MTLKQFFYTGMIVVVVFLVAVFAVSNYQNVIVSIPFMGSYKTKLFLVIIAAYFAGFFTAAFLSLISRLLPSNRRKKQVESGPVSPSGSPDKKEGNG